jgi:hypothetical protein
MNGYEVRSQNVNEVVVNLARALPINSLKDYCKHPTKRPGLIYFRKRFFDGLIQGWGLYTGGGANTWTIFCVSNKQVRHKQVSHKQENKHVLITRVD